MEAIHTHPVNALQAMAFTAPGSLSYPGGHTELTPPHDSFDGSAADNSQKTATTTLPGSAESSFGAGGLDGAAGSGVVTPVTPVAMPSVVTSGSGLVPVLQYV